MKNIFSHFYSIRIKVFATFFLALLPVYILGFSLFLWGYEKLTAQIEAAQLSQVQFYADSLDSEIQRIRNLQYECVHDEDLLYLVNAYPILDSFEKSQYMLRVQQRLQIMKNSSTSIDAIVVHLPAINKSISNAAVFALDPQWESVAALNASASNGIVFFSDENLIKMLIQYPVLPRDGRIPRVLMEITLSNDKICDILEGFRNYPGNELILKSLDDTFCLSNLEGREPSSALTETKNMLETSVFLKCADLELISTVPHSQLFSFTNTYLYIFAAFTVVSILVMIAFAFSIRHMIHKPIQTLISAFSEIKEHHFDTRIRQKRNDEFQYLYDRFNSTMDYLQELVEQVYDQQLLTQRAELKQLQSQINPHFLYNSFYNIYRMAKREGNENTARLSNLLSEYYQYITRNAADEVPLETELRHAQIYLDIQSIRFGDRLRIFTAPIPEDLKRVFVPRLIIQPLLENAFEHGIQNTDQPFISLTFEEDSASVRICVEDNGSGLSADELSDIRCKLVSSENALETTAIINIHRRLRLRFGLSSGLTISKSDYGGLRVQLQIPKEEATDV